MQVMKVFKMAAGSVATLVLLILSNSAMGAQVERIRIDHRSQIAVVDVAYGGCGEARPEFFLKLQECTDNRGFLRCSYELVQDREDGGCKMSIRRTVLIPLQEVEVPQLGTLQDLLRDREKHGEVLVFGDRDFGGKKTQARCVLDKLYLQ